jgi:outer membrane protein assembly factor BamB
VFVGSDDGALYNVSAVDGRTRWRCALGSPVLSSPVVASGVVVVGGTDGGIHAVDLHTGDRRWTCRTQHPVLASPRLAAGSTYGAMYAIEPSEGGLLWSVQIAHQITSTIGSHGGYGYVGTIDGCIHCLNLKDGQTVWSHKIGSPDEMPDAKEDFILVRNPHRRDGKPLTLIAGGVSTLIYPWSRVTYVEILGEGLGSTRESIVGFFRDSDRAG